MSKHQSNSQTGNCHGDVDSTSSEDVHLRKTKIAIPPTPPSVTYRSSPHSQGPSFWTFATRSSCRAANSTLTAESSCRNSHININREQTNEGELSGKRFSQPHTSSYKEIRKHGSSENSSVHEINEHGSLTTNFNFGPCRTHRVLEGNRFAAIESSVEEGNFATENAETHLGTKRNKRKAPPMDTGFFNELAVSNGCESGESDQSLYGTPKRTKTSTEFRCNLNGSHSSHLDETKQRSTAQKLQCDIASSESFVGNRISARKMNGKLKADPPVQLPASSNDWLIENIVSKSQASKNDHMDHDKLLEDQALCREPSKCQKHVRPDPPANNSGDRKIVEADIELVPRLVYGVKYTGDNSRHPNPDNGRRMDCRSLNESNFEAVNSSSPGLILTKSKCSSSDESIRISEDEEVGMKVSEAQRGKASDDSLSATTAPTVTGAETMSISRSDKFSDGNAILLNFSNNDENSSVPTDQTSSERASSPGISIEISSRLKGKKEGSGTIPSTNTSFLDNNAANPGSGNTSADFSPKPGNEMILQTATSTQSTIGSPPNGGVVETVSAEKSANMEIDRAQARYHKNQQNESFSMEDFYGYVRSGSVETIGTGLNFLYEPFKTLAPGKTKHMLKSFITAINDIEDGWSGAVVHLWARSRYRKSRRYRNTRIKSNYSFLDTVDHRKDAVESLKLLIDHGADVFASDGDGQTPLHHGMSCGLSCVVEALFEMNTFDIDRLNAINTKGETPLELAFYNGHFACCRLLIHQCDTETLFRLRDSKQNNIIAMIVRNTNIQYDIKKSLYEKAESFVLLHELLEVIEREKLIEVLINENIHGENALHIAARNGYFYEVEAITKLQFGSGRSVANRCIGNGIGKLISPLDIAMETKRVVEIKQPPKDVEMRPSFARFHKRKIKFKNWMRNGIIPTVNLLQEIQKHLPVDLNHVLATRPSGAKISHSQILSEEAKKFRDDHLGSEQRLGDPKIFLHQMKNIKRTNEEQYKSQILKLLANGTISQVSCGLLRDPKHSCVRNSTDSTAPQYCLLAVDDIDAGTVICEYAGLVRRETEQDSLPQNSSYGFKLQKLDDWVMKKAHSGNEKSFILDARLVFNESSLINDLRTDVLVSDKPEREENVGCKEVLINKWPHIFLVTKRDVKAGEELVTDYGPSYWEKHVVAILRERDEKNRHRIELLGRKLTLGEGK